MGANLSKGGSAGWVPPGEDEPGCTWSVMEPSWGWWRDVPILLRPGQAQAGTAGKPGPSELGPGFRGLGGASVGVAVPVAVAPDGFLLLGLLDHQGLRGQQHAGDGRGVL